MRFASRSLLFLLLVFPIGVCCAQEAFELDQGFRTTFERVAVHSAISLPNGSVIISCNIDNPSPLGGYWYLLRLFPNGTMDTGFAFEVGGGGKLILRDSVFYISQEFVWRAYLDGRRDTTFDMYPGINSLYSPGSTFDYHVFPDGRILLSGDGFVHHPELGNLGEFNLIWFNANGQLDYTRTNRRANGATYQFAELPDGKFIVTCNCTIYDGLPSRHIFRIHPDGALDLNFDTQVTEGFAHSYLPLPDGRVYVGGKFVVPGLAGSQSLVRFLPDGSLDFGFTPPYFSKGELTSGPFVEQIKELAPNRILVMGEFRQVNQQDRGGICMLDSTGALLPDFDDAGCGTYTDFSTFGFIRGIERTVGNKFFLYGAYHGFNDGATNDTTQRLISRFHAGDLFTEVEEKPAEIKRFSVFPNPTSGHVTFAYELEQPRKDAYVVVRDLFGRTVVQLPMKNNAGQMEFDTRALASGLYTVSFTQAGKILQVENLVVE